MDDDIKLPEPVAWLAEYGGDVYTADQMRAYADATEALRHPSDRTIYEGIAARYFEAGRDATAPLLARIAELEAELEKTKAIFAASCNHAAVMEMERDARRYRWLRARWGRSADEYDGNSDQLVATREADSHFEGWGVDPESLDAAIDAAMKEQGYA